MAVKQSIKSQWDAAKAALRGKCAALNALIREEERQKSNDPIPNKSQKKSKVRINTKQNEASLM